MNLASARLVAAFPVVCRRALYLRAVLATSSCRPFSDEVNERGQHQDSGRGEGGEDAKSRARRMSLATGSAVAALGASYILYHNHFKLKAQEEVNVLHVMAYIDFWSDGC